MAGKKGRTGASYKNFYSAYAMSERWKINKLRRLKKLLKKYPNNKELAKAIARRENNEVGPKHRTTFNPKTLKWS